MTPRETQRFHVHALRNGVKVDMKIVERDRRLFLWDGLASHPLTVSPDAWTAPKLEAEIMELTHATRVVVV